MVFYILGTVDVPRDLPMFYVGYFFMAWCAVAITLIIGALSERTDWVQQIWLPCSYMYMMYQRVWDDGQNLWRPNVHGLRSRGDDSGRPVAAA